VAKSGDTDPEVPKQDQQNEPNPTGIGDRDEETGRRESSGRWSRTPPAPGRTHRPRTFRAADGAPDA